MYVTGGEHGLDWIRSEFLFEPIGFNKIDLD